MSEESKTTEAWKWLEEILYTESPYIPDGSLIGSPKTLDTIRKMSVCIKEMRSSLETILKYEDPSKYFVHRQTLNRCARGSFNE